ncbi:MAG: ABC transporter permease [Verrucomicrobia bacterium]|nr:ABC transporter permease [Cytophagales bacterium]
MTQTTTKVAETTPQVVAPEPVQSPFYYVKKRLLKNKPAMVGLGIILFGIVIALLGYLIMPDSTPNANDSAPQIKKKPAGFRITMFRQRKNIDVEKVNLFQKIFTGRESEYSITPITSYRIDENKLLAYVKMYGVAEEEEEHSIVDAVLYLFVGETAIVRATTGVKNEDGNYHIDGNTITYADENEKVQKISKQELLRRFKSECIEERTYILGTDESGRDMLSRLIFGFRISLSIGVVAVFISLMLGTTLGSIAGFFGGRTDAFVIWLMTVVWSIPSIMLVIAISLALQSRGIWVAFVAVGLTTWVEIARLVRGQILSIKKKTYIEAAGALGLSNRRIIVNHILPNILGPLIVVMASNFASAILTEAGLSFVGLGVQPPMPSWGSMIYEGFKNIGTTDSFHLIFYPSLFISILVLAFNLFGNGLRDAYDPTSQG